MFCRASSGASPLPHLPAFQSWNAVKCGSGLAREEAITAYAKACSSATPAPVSPEYGAVTNHTGIPLK
ncbi:hypothetical protein FW800_09065 [Pseudomonas sp. 910_23]|nr:hypothetical protein [Pseudomonas sp. W2Aug9]MCK3854390.1 hypothetical protein [Pseudomonas sp. W2Jun17]